MKKDRLAHLLTENDRNGERAIALFQALIALIVFAFHVAAASKNQWQTFSPFLLSLTGLVLVTCVLRFSMAPKIENNRGKLARIVTAEKIENQNFLLGRIVEVHDTIIRIQIKDHEIDIPFHMITKARLEIEL